MTVVVVARSCMPRPSASTSAAGSTKPVRIVRTAARHSPTGASLSTRVTLRSEGMAAYRRQNWHDGPEIPNQFSGEETLPEYPGQFLGMPKEGTGSQASVLRRMGGVFIDWALCAVAASLITALDR